MDMKTKMKSCTLCILFWGLFIFPVNGDRDCVIGILPSLNPCQESFLGNTLPSKPSAECCNGAKKFSALGTSTKLCGCLKLYLLSSQILHSKLNSIPHLCNIPALSPAVNCATATDGGFDQLKNAEVSAFRPTTPGHSPGIGNR
ncbi:transmembrane protein [Perilla frutescens var. frutescens]|nr:transmembrane protein [Perilla frutescens var. frutescens]